MTVFWKSALVAAAFCAVCPGFAVAQSVVADLSDREIAITTGFTGAELLLYGATEGYGDIVVKVAGPRREEVVRRKQRVAGIWINGASVAFRGAPAYYRVAASRSLEEIAPPAVLKRHRIGAGTLELPTASTRSQAEIAEFRKALLRNKRRLGLYGDSVSEISVTGGRLFRTSISFPSIVPTGRYLATVYLFHDGRLVQSDETPLTVRKDGLGAEIFRFAHEQASWYGAIAILIALVAGWLAGAIFRRT